VIPESVRKDSYSNRHHQYFFPGVVNFSKSHQSKTVLVMISVKFWGFLRLLHDEEGRSFEQERVLRKCSSCFDGCV